MTTLRPELLDELLADYETPEDLLGDEGLLKQLKKALLERALGAELSDHLGYECKILRHLTANLVTFDRESCRT